MNFSRPLNIMTKLVQSNNGYTTVLRVESLENESKIAEVSRYLISWKPFKTDTTRFIHCLWWLILYSLLNWNQRVNWNVHQVNVLRPLLCTEGPMGLHLHFICTTLHRVIGLGHGGSAWEFRNDHINNDTSFTVFSELLYHWTFVATSSFITTCKWARQGNFFADL